MPKQRPGDVCFAGRCLPQGLFLSGGTWGDSEEKELWGEVTGGVMELWGVSDQMLGSGQ